jgi:hypothetical protein
MRFVIQFYFSGSWGRKEQTLNIFLQIYKSDDDVFFTFENYLPDNIA